MNEPMLDLQKLTIGYSHARRPDFIVAEDLSVTLRAGEMACLLGPNDAGKSTLMRTIAGMQAPLAGRVLLRGEDIHRLPSRALARRLSVVLTERAPVGILSAYALVALGRHPHTNWAGTLKEKDHEVVRWAMQTVGAAELARRSVDELSDGERQKVMVARALAQEPQVMILDEITAFLDLPRRIEMMQILRDLAHRENRAILLSTHDLDLALRSADRIWLLPMDGEICAGMPEDLVLSGAFSAAFASEGVEFDQRDGSFKIHRRAAIGEIGVTSEGTRAYWTARALERHGFQVHRNGTEPAVKTEVLFYDGRTVWQLIIEGEIHTFTSLEDLISFMRSRAKF
jgi:iron complex transport system ATP-binding protein